MRGPPPVAQPTIERLRRHDQLFSTLQQLDFDIQESKAENATPALVQEMIRAYDKAEIAFQDNLSHVLVARRR